MTTDNKTGIDKQSVGQRLVGEKWKQRWLGLVLPALLLLPENQPLPLTLTSALDFSFSFSFSVSQIASKADFDYLACLFLALRKALSVRYRCRQIPDRAG